MKIFSGLVLFVLCAFVVRAAITFEGYMVTQERSLFVLSIDKERTSRWLTLGQSFDGFVLLAFDPKANILTVEKDGTRQDLPLVEGKTQSASKATNQVASSPIVVSIAGQESIGIGEDAASLDALKSKLALVATIDPQPTIVIQATARTKIDQINTVMDLVRSYGLKRFSVRSEK